MSEWEFKPGLGLDLELENFNIGAMRSQCEDGVVVVGGAAGEAVEMTMSSMYLLLAVCTYDKKYVLNSLV